MLSVDLTDSTVACELRGHCASGPPGGGSDRRHDYGESDKGVLQVGVADRFRFMGIDSAGFGVPGSNVEWLTRKDGIVTLCMRDACSEDDRR